MMRRRRIELLAPARNLECGLEAVNHGADAVYIGAPRFGARAAAGNSIEDLHKLVEYAHRYRVRIYVTVNTLLKDDELEDTRQMIWELYRIGVDAVIVQDPALLRMPLPPIPLHASTQMDNRTPEKVRFLWEQGFRQAVLARELSLAEIRAVHEAVPEMQLEVFVHGALCVSYSGQCYASQACFGRSANRGECAQFCRLPFTLEDAEGRTISRDKYLLSLKDLNRSEWLEQLLDAGVTSLKIEGRLKEVSYVKNVTAWYCCKLDEIFSRRPEYGRSSSGVCTYTFTPQPDKSFNRGFTSYFLQGREPDVCSPDTPKSTGEMMGTVKEIRPGYILMAGTKHFCNGDGACFIDEHGCLQGFRINRVEENRLYPQEMPRLRPRTVLYRNYDQAFGRLLSRPSGVRKIDVGMEWREQPAGFSLELTDEDGFRYVKVLRREKEPARTPQEEHLRAQLERLGDTPFRPVRVTVPAGFRWFIPSSVLAEMRRGAVEGLMRVRRIGYPVELVRRQTVSSGFYRGEKLSCLANALNRESVKYYLEQGAAEVQPAFELRHASGIPLMCCKHCIRYLMGWCPQRQKVQSPYREPYYLVSRDGRRFRLEFDCRSCQMKVYEEV